jgi:hypothetical protein
MKTRIDSLAINSGNKREIQKALLQYSQQRRIPVKRLLLLSRET